MLQLWHESVAMSPKIVVQDVYVAWQSSSGRRSVSATQDNYWLHDSHEDLPGFVDKHWKRFFSTSVAALSR